MRVAVLSDIHANLVALDAILAAIGSVDAVWQLGDIVGYGPEPDGVVERLRAVGAVGVRGNHDAATLGEIDLDWFNDDARRAVEWTRGRASAATLAYLRALPEIAVPEDVALVHGSFREPVWEYVTHAPIARASLARLAEHGVTIGCFGHTHLPRVFRDDGGRVETITPSDGSTLAIDDRPVLLNPGSVGQPRDGDRTASAMVLDLGRREARWVRTTYDIAAVQEAMRSAGLPERLAARLSYGL